MLREPPAQLDRKDLLELQGLLGLQDLKDLLESLAHKVRRGHLELQALQDQPVPLEQLVPRAPLVLRDLSDLLDLLDLEE